VTTTRSWRKFVWCNCGFKVWWLKRVSKGGERWEDLNMVERFKEDMCWKGGLVKVKAKKIRRMNGTMVKG